MASKNPLSFFHVKETKHLSEILNEPVLTQLEVEIFHPQVETKKSSVQVLSSEGFKCDSKLSFQLIESEGMVVPSVKVSHL